MCVFYHFQFNIGCNWFAVQDANTSHKLFFNARLYFSNYNDKFEVWNWIQIHQMVLIVCGLVDLPNQALSRSLHPAILRGLVWGSFIFVLIFLFCFILLSLPFTVNLNQASPFSWTKQCGDSSVSTVCLWDSCPWSLLILWNSLWKREQFLLSLSFSAFP